MADEFENGSGQGAGTPVPTELLGKFNWGAFCLSWIWGIGNQSWLTFIIFATALVSWIPIVGFFAPLGVAIWFGLKGNEWAWQNKRWRNLEHFQEVQKTWAIWGIVIFVLSIVLSIFAWIVLIGLAAASGY